MEKLKEHRGRKANIELKKRINGLVIAGYSFQSIANILGIKSRQLVRYHWHKWNEYCEANKIIDKKDENLSTIIDLKNKKEKEKN